MNALLDPMAVIVIAIAIALYLATRARAGEALSTPRRRARTLAWLGLALLYLLSCPAVVGTSARAIETLGEADLDRALAGHDPSRMALVVLAGGERGDDPLLPPSEQLEDVTQGRVIAGARLYREHKFGVVIATGAPATETQGMGELLTRLGVPSERIRLESASLDTHENALFSGAILRSMTTDSQTPLEGVVLVTSALHLARSVRYFERAGVPVIPVAGDVRTYVTDGSVLPILTGLLPSSKALFVTLLASHEVIGNLKQAVLRLRGR